MFARPKPGETEEDLLRLQEEFMAQKMAPAATVVRHPTKRSAEIPENETKPEARDMVSMEVAPMQTSSQETKPPKKKSRFRDQQEKKRQNVRFEEDPEEMLDKHDKDLTSVLSEIVERDVAHMPVFMPNLTKHGFPAVRHRGDIQNSSANQSQKKSLFAQQFEQSNAADFGLTCPINQPVIPNIQSARLKQPQGISHIIDGTGLNQSNAPDEARNIHEENTSKMAAMTEQEILEEQRKLMETLDPSLLGFLKSRKKKMEENSESETQQNEEMETETPSEEIKKMDVISKEELPIKPDKDWVHMDKVETEKLSWMKDLPPPSAAKAEGQQARFDLLGKVVPVDADMPTNLGLHHHGHEPERAGYSLEELFTLARSANMQQRVFALQTLAKIIVNARQGDFHELLQKPVIPSLVEGGLVFLLRWALDDTADNALAATVQCFHALLVHQEDEHHLEETFSWYRGYELQSLSPAEPEKDEEADEEEKPQQTDADVIKDDLVKGLLRMTLLIRLRYILEKWKPAAPVVSDILDILIRIARHSAQSCHEIMQCPRLVSVIIDSFLPTSWNPQDSDKVNAYGYPSPNAMKLMQVMCTSGRHLAAILVSNHRLFDRIFRYIAVGHNELQLSASDARALILWSVNTWKICSCYGLGADYFREYYPVMTGYLQQIQMLSSQSNHQDILHAASVVSVLESVLHVAASTVDLVKQNSGSDTVPVPPINWSHVTGLLQPVQMCMQRHLEEFMSSYSVQKQNLSILSACLNFMASYLSRVENQPGTNTVEILEYVESLCNKQLIPCLSSHAFQVTMANISAHSLILSPDVSTSHEALANLPQQCSHMGAKASLIPIISKNSPFNFLTAFFRLLLSAAKVHKGFTEKLFRPVLENQDLVVYLRKVCVVDNPVVTSIHFIRFENILQSLILNMTRKLAECSSQKLSSIHLYHQMALHLVNHLRIGDEHTLHELLSTVLFNFEFLHDTRNDATSSILESLQLKESDPLLSATQKPINIDHGQMLTDICANLSSIRASYITAFSHLASHVKKSRSRALDIPHKIDGYLLGGFDQVLVPADWMYLPILELYQKTLQLQEKAGISEESVPPSLITAVTNTLRWVFFLHNWRSHVMNNVSMATKITRVMCTFLAGSDLFLENQIHVNLAGLLQIYCKPNMLDHVDFTKRIPGVASFYDFYTAFLTQYEAVSFGDPVFACYVLFPLQQKHKVELRKCVWGEHAGILRFLSIPLKQLQIPLRRYLEPAENDVELVWLYFRCLMSQTVRRQWCPIMYAIAVHHVNTFMYSHDTVQATVRVAMLQQCVRCPLQELKKHLLFYKTCDTDADLGFLMYDTLPQIRQNTLNTLGLTV